MREKQNKREKTMIPSTLRQQFRWRARDLNLKHARAAKRLTRVKMTA